MAVSNHCEVSETWTLSKRLERLHITTPSSATEALQPLLSNPLLKNQLQPNTARPGSTYMPMCVFLGRFEFYVEKALAAELPLHRPGLSVPTLTKLLPHTFRRDLHNFRPNTWDELKDRVLKAARQHLRLHYSHYDTMIYFINWKVPRGDSTFSDCLLLLALDVASTAWTIEEQVGLAALQRLQNAFNVGGMDLVQDLCSTPDVFPGPSGNNSTWIGSISATSNEPFATYLSNLASRLVPRKFQRIKRTPSDSTTNRFHLSLEGEPILWNGQTPIIKEKWRLVRYLAGCTSRKDKIIATARWVGGIIDIINAYSPQNCTTIAHLVLRLMPAIYADAYRTNWYSLRQQAITEAPIDQLSLGNYSRLPTDAAFVTIFGKNWSYQLTQAAGTVNLREFDSFSSFRAVFTLCHELAGSEPDVLVAAHSQVPQLALLGTVEDMEHYFEYYKWPDGGVRYRHVD